MLRVFSRHARDPIDHIGESDSVLLLCSRDATGESGCVSCTRDATGCSTLARVSHGTPRNWKGGLDCFPYFIVLLSQTNERNATPGERMNDKNRFSRDLLRVSTIFDGVIVQVVRNHFFSSSFHNVSKLYV